MLINVILRVLPFWIREPLLIAVSLFFAGLALYWFAVAGEWQRAAFGIAFLAVAILRAFILRREWRSRPKADQAG
jgi:membrane protein YdbS with pleckstrin-like domain